MRDIDNWAGSSDLAAPENGDKARSQCAMSPEEVRRRYILSSPLNI